MYALCCATATTQSAFRKLRNTYPTNIEQRRANEIMLPFAVIKQRKKNNRRKTTHLN